MADARELSKVDENELISHHHKDLNLAENSEDYDTARKDGYEPDTPKLGVKSMESA